MLSAFALWIGASLGGCSYDQTGVEIAGAGDVDARPAPVDSAPDQPDAAMSMLAEDVIQVPAAGEFASTAELRLSAGDVIDTATLQINGTDVPDGVIFDVHVADDSGGAELAILHVRSLTIADDALVTAKGTRPLVIIAGEQIELMGLLDASASRDVPGPGGFGPLEGPGAGGSGEHSGMYSDGGGAGGGFGQPGGDGGQASCGGCPTAAGGVGGVAYGGEDLAVLQGGSGGGAAVNVCKMGAPPPPGGGGGAVQLYAGVSISLSAKGGVHVGGGGGGKGIDCAQWSAGTGGGSGGAIFLQSPVVVNDGTLAANGGGGSSGAGSPTGDPMDGIDGEDGEDAWRDLTPAAGGSDVGAWSKQGGAGGYGAEQAEDGRNEGQSGGNGGGGGGGVGRIAILSHDGVSSGTGTSSPAAYEASYQQ